MGGRAIKSKLVVLLFAIVCLYVPFNEDKQHHNMYTFDKAGYYIYLPATFIYDDLQKLSFYPGLDSQYHHSIGLQYSLHTVKENTITKYPVGVAICELPFFLAAHGYCVLTRQYAADGWTLPYQLAGIFSNLLFVILGLLVLRKFLLRYYSDNVAALALLFVSFGTNLYCYTAFDPGMSHTFSFCLFALLLYTTDLCYRSSDVGARRYILWAGPILGLIVLLRPTNLLAILIPVFWGVYDVRTLRSRLSFFRQNIRYVLFSALLFVVTISPQLAYWKYVTGDWLVYAYKGETMDLLHPHLLQGLFSYRKGYLLYTPMAVLCFAGFYALWKKNKRLVPVLVCYFILAIYSVFSWEQWWYGGGFGCRPLIESLAFLIFPLAAAIDHVISRPRKLLRGVFFTVAFLFVFLNMFQTYQYSMGILHWSRMTKTYYWKIFGKVNIDRAETEKYLLEEGQ